MQTRRAAFDLPVVLLVHFQVFTRFFFFCILISIVEMLVAVLLDLSSLVFFDVSKSLFFFLSSSFSISLYKCLVLNTHSTSRPHILLNSPEAASLAEGLPTQSAKLLAEK